MFVNFSSICSSNFEARASRFEVRGFLALGGPPGTRFERSSGQIQATQKHAPCGFSTRSASGGSFSRPRDRQKTAQEEKPVPGKLSRHPAADVAKKMRRRGGGEDDDDDDGAPTTLTPDVAIFFATWTPGDLDPFPRTVLFVLNRCLTVPGPGDGLRRPKTSKSRPLQFVGCVAGI